MSIVLVLIMLFFKDGTKRLTEDMEVIEERERGFDTRGNERPG